MLYVRFPLSLRNVEDLLHERGDRRQPRDPAVLVEQIWSDFRGRDPVKPDQPNACAVELAMALGRGFFEDQR